MTRGWVRNWAEFQHYKDRAPPWIKLHRKLLDNYDYARLPVASKALAPLLWLIAAESSDGSFDADPGYLSFRTHIPEADVVAGLKPLISANFVEVASATLAPCLQDACPEREGETERETEGEGGASAPARPSKRKQDSTIADWLSAVDGDAIPAHDPVFQYADKINLPADYLHLAWVEFEARHRESGKRYKDWRAAFRKCVRDNWYKLWWQSGDGWALTTAGQQARKAAA